MWVAPLPVSMWLQRKAYSQVTQSTSAAVSRAAELQASAGTAGSAQGLREGAMLQMKTSLMSRKR